MNTQTNRVPRVLVVGAGISGLAFAHYVRRLAAQRGLRVEIRVFEAETTPGGRVKTLTQRGFRVEVGANGVLGSKPAAIALAYELGLGAEVVRANPVARNRFIYHRGRLHPLPLSLLQFCKSELLSPGAKLRLLLEPFVPRTPSGADWSVERWAARRLGSETTRVLVDALCTGIYAAPPAQLSLRAAFPRLWELEQRGGSLLLGALRELAAQKRLVPGYEASLPEGFPRRGLWSLRSGLGTLTRKLAESLDDCLSCGSQVLQIGKRRGRWVVAAEGYRIAVEGDWLVLATEAFESARLLRLQLPDAARELAGVRYVPIVVAALGYRSSEFGHPLNGFGFLVPSGERRQVLGVLWSSSVFPGRAPDDHVLLRAMVGGYGGESLLNEPDEQIERIVGEELARTMGVTARPVFRLIIRWRRAIPLPEPGHVDRVMRIERALRQEPRLLLLGNYLHGVSVNDCVASAYQAATRVVAELDYLARHRDSCSQADAAIP